MLRAAVLPILVGALASGFLALAPQAAAEPEAYLIGACWDPGKPVEQEPSTIIYGCDSSSVMVDMTWTSWNADGATGTGTDDAVECQPNCAQGRRLANPIIVHAWNPLSASDIGCPPGIEFYSDYTVAYPAGVPPWVRPGTSWTEGVDYVYVDGLPAVHFSGQRPFSCTPQLD
jgi:hypothetical protein